VFKWDLPAGGDWETKCFRTIREWMFKNGHSSDTAFELFLQKVDRILQKRLSRSEFHRVLHMVGFKFSAPEIDALFKLLDANNDGELDIEEWKTRIYEDSLNPLQMLREIV
jgi:Ca2+-binding EF-hand superfamily protein